MRPESQFVCDWRNMRAWLAEGEPRTLSYFAKKFLKNCWRPGYWRAS